MKKLTQKDVKALFANLCCSRCKNEFTLDSIKILDKDCDTLHCRLLCAKCGKDFGDIVLNFNRKSDKHMPLEIIDGPAPISVDDVIDAHKFIKKLK